MGGNRVAARRAATRDKVLALGAAGLVLVAGSVAASFAAWSDIEWIAGGVDTTAGVTTSTFEVEQLAESDADWGDYETQGTPNVVDFGAAAATLTPGDTVYGYVLLRTKVDSLGGDLSLAADTTVAPDSLSAALTYGARVMPDASTCDAADYASAGTELVAADSALTVGGASTFALAPATATDPGASRAVCFAITFPASFAADDSLQGETASPVWHFDAVSVVAP